MSTIPAMGPNSTLVSNSTTSPNSSKEMVGTDTNSSVLTEGTDTVGTTGGTVDTLDSTIGSGKVDTLVGADTDFQLLTDVVVEIVFVVGEVYPLISFSCCSS